MKKAFIHQSPAEKLAATSAGTIQAIRQGTEAVTRAIKEIPKSDNSEEVKGLADISYEVNVNTRHIKKLEEHINNPEMVVKKLDEVRKEASTTNTLLTEIREKKYPEQKEFPTEMRIIVPDGLILKGHDGHTPTKDELEAIIKPLIPKPVDGKDYVLTEKDKKDIASKIPPKIEKVIEKPVVTNEIVEVAKYEEPDDIVDKVNKAKKLINPSKVAGLVDALNEINKIGTNPTGIDVGGSGKVVRYLDDGTEVSAHVTELNFGTGLEAIYENNGRVTVNNTGGAGSGITRTIVSTSGNATMGATASTDYVYIVTGAHTMTLPTAVGNTNLYTVRNNHSAPITVNTTSSQNIIGSVTATSYSVYNGDARSFISNGTAWSIV